MEPPSESLKYNGSQGRVCVSRRGAQRQVGAPMSSLAARRRVRGKTSSGATAVLQAEGESSGDEAEGEAKPTTRAQCGQFVWPCPREYPGEC